MKIVTVALAIGLFAGRGVAKEVKMIDQLEALSVNGTKQWLLYRGADVDLVSN